MARPARGKKSPKSASASGGQQTANSSKSKKRPHQSAVRDQNLLTLAHPTGLDRTKGKISFHPHRELATQKKKIEYVDRVRTSIVQCLAALNPHFPTSGETASAGVFHLHEPSRLRLERVLVPGECWTAYVVQVEWELEVYSTR